VKINIYEHVESSNNIKIQKWNKNLCSRAIQREFRNWSFLWHKGMQNLTMAIH